VNDGPAIGDEPEITHADRPAPAFADRPDLVVPSRDGTPIAVFALGDASSLLPPLLLVHGTSADHLTWRVAGPLLAGRRRVLAMDRRGRGDSGDTAAWAIEHELDDVAAVAAAIAAGSGAPVDVVGHSLGGRIALAAGVQAGAIGRVVAYESAPGIERTPRDLVERLRGLLDLGDLDGLLATFMTEVVGMPPDDLAAFRADPIWPRRAAAGRTIVRELEATSAPAIGLDALAAVTVPVLQLVGSASPSRFRDGAAALDARLARGRLEVIEGARHAAHHSHPAELTARIEAFLDG
jgi:pimeloyl-ACP methyl ester carboxylesterase